MLGHDKPKACLLRLQKEYQRLSKEPVRAGGAGTRASSVPSFDPERRVPLPTQVPNITAEPRPNNILEWHFVIAGALPIRSSQPGRLGRARGWRASGPPATQYEGGQYHGKLIFPSEYPYKPPAIMMLTPNGRFNTNTRRAPLAPRPHTAPPTGR